MMWISGDWSATFVGDDEGDLAAAVFVVDAEVVVDGNHHSFIMKF